MNDIEILFLRTLDDLEDRIKSHDPYEILGISALIRKLLLDSYPLVDQVNRNYKLKICFETVYSGSDQLEWMEKMGMHPLLWIIPDGLDVAPPELPRNIINRQRFLSTTVLAVRGKRYSIRDIVLFEANVMGGVHAGSPKDEKQRVIAQINETLTVEGYRASLKLLKSIGRVVLEALKSLHHDVLKAHHIGK